MLQQIKNTCQQFADYYAFYIQGKGYTYKTFSQILSNVRTEIEKLTTAQKLIGVIANDNIETYAAIYGIMFSGNGFVPINPKHPITRNINIIKQADIQTIFTQKNGEFENILKKQIPNINIIETQKLPNKNINLNLPNSKPHDIAYLLFTSGSTGEAKGVPITNQNIEHFIQNFLNLNYDIDQTDRFLQMADLTFDLSVISYMLPLTIGACIYTLPDDGIKYMNIYSLLEEEEITFAIMVPSVLTYLKKYFDDIQLPMLRYSLFCGEALYANIAQEWSKCMPNGTIINTYGPTEATVLCTYYNMTQNNNLSHNGIISIGKPIPNMQIAIADENGNILPNQQTGEICISGTQLTPGYWKNETKNQRAFFNTQYNGKTQRFYRSGDIGFYDKQGYLYYIGRTDAQVKIDGYRIELGEIEYHARQFTNINNIAAITYNDNIGNTRIHLFLEKYTDNHNELTQYLKTKIATYMMPQEITSIDNFPINDNGKIDRKALLKTKQ